MERFFASVKRELVHDEDDTNRDEVRASIVEYFEVFDNRVRRHSSRGDVAPAGYERMHNQTHRQTRTTFRGELHSAKNRSTWLSRDELVGMTCEWYRLLQQPPLHCRRLVRRVVVEYEADARPRLLREGGVEVVENLHELLMPMSPVAPADDPPGGHVPGGEQGRGAVADVVGAPFGTTTASRPRFAPTTFHCRTPGGGRTGSRPRNGLRGSPIAFRTAYSATSPLRFSTRSMTWPSASRRARHRASSPRWASWTIDVNSNRSFGTRYGTARCLWMRRWSRPAPSHPAGSLLTRPSLAAATRRRVGREPRHARPALGSGQRGKAAVAVVTVAVNHVASGAEIGDDL